MYDTGCHPRQSGGIAFFIGKPSRLLSGMAEISLRLPDAEAALRNRVNRGDGCGRHRALQALRSGVGIGKAGFWREAPVSQR